MSRKNLSRTVIEGGRTFYSSHSRRASHGIARARAREWLAHIADDLEEAEATDPLPTSRVSKEFHDKLGPAQRWLHAQVGRPWNKVYSDLRARFDARTIAGKHVVDDHMLGMVRRFDDPPERWPRRTLVIDRHGILQNGEFWQRSFKSRRREALKWAAGRSCTLTPNGWRWVRRVPLGQPCEVHFSPVCGVRDHHAIDGTWYHRVVANDAGAMTLGEIRRLHRISTEIGPFLVIVNPWAR